MGRTVAELEQTLTVEELEEWQAYHFFEPFGAPAEDERWRINYTLFHIAHLKGGDDIRWLDRDPEETARRMKAHEMSLDDRIMAALVASGSKIIEAEAIEFIDPDEPEEEPTA